MKKASEFAVDSTVQSKKNSKFKGTVIGNKLSDGDYTLAVEWQDGTLAKVHTNDVEPSLSLEEEFKLVQDQVNGKLAEAAKLIREAADLATTVGKELANPEYGYVESEFNVDQIEGAMGYAGWNTSSWYC